MFPDLSPKHDEVYINGQWMNITYKWDLKGTNDAFDPEATKIDIVITTFVSTELYSQHET